MSKRKYKGISRIDSDLKKMHGWFARVYLYGKVYANKFFSDRKYGGKRQALKLAIEYRNDMTKERNEKHPGSDKARRRVIKDKRNKTGIIGISRSKQVNRSGTVSEYYQVTWRPKPNVVRSRSFSIKKYGEVEALFLAWKVRREAEIKMYGKAQQPSKDVWEKNIKLKKLPPMPDF